MKGDSLFTYIVDSIAIGHVIFLTLRKWENFVYYQIWACQMTNVMYVESKSTKKKIKTFKQSLNRESEPISLINSQWP